MPTTEVISGEKGGVGKSQVALGIISYLTEMGIQLVVCETDRSNGDVGRTVEGKNGHTVLYPYFSEDSSQMEKADGVLDAVLEKDTTGVVNCPAQNHRAILEWFNQGSAEMAMEEGVTLRFWFVTSGGYDSMALFFESINDFPNIPHVLVRNNYFTDGLVHDYSDPQKNESVAKVIGDYKVPVIEFPAFGDLGHLTVNNLTFGEAISKESGLQTTIRSRLRKALRLFFTQLDTIYLPQTTTEIETTKSDESANKQTAKRKQSSRKTTARKKRNSTEKSVGNSKKD